MTDGCTCATCVLGRANRHQAKMINERDAKIAELEARIAELANESSSKLTRYLQRWRGADASSSPRTSPDPDPA